MINEPMNGQKERDDDQPHDDDFVSLFVPFSLSLYVCRTRNGSLPRSSSSLVHHFVFNLILVPFNSIPSLSFLLFLFSFWLLSSLLEEMSLLNSVNSYQEMLEEEDDSKRRRNGGGHLVKCQEIFLCISYWKNTDSQKSKRSLLSDRNLFLALPLFHVIKHTELSIEWWCLLNEWSMCSLKELPS